jgi:hypothetical protein
MCIEFLNWDWNNTIDWPALVCMKSLQKQRQEFYSFSKQTWGIRVSFAVHTGVPSSGGQIVQSIRLIWHFHLMSRTRIKLYHIQHIIVRGLDTSDECHWQNYDFMDLISLGFRLLPQLSLELWSSFGLYIHQNQFSHPEEWGSMCLQNVRTSNCYTL